MEELFKERKEKLNIIKNLLRKPKEEKNATNNTSNIPEGFPHQTSERSNTISIIKDAFKCWWIKTVFEKSPPD
ncbi:MAG: hypothetical protein ACLRX7_08060 [Acutalibacteraceae bacterium]